MSTTVKQEKKAYWLLEHPEEYPGLLERREFDRKLLSEESLHSPLACPLGQSPLALPLERSPLTHPPHDRPCHPAKSLIWRQLRQ